jgi:hypothetical protein
MSDSVLAGLPVAKRLWAKRLMAKKCLLGVAGLVAIAGPLGVGLRSGASIAHAAETTAAEMRRYENREWKFSLDVPRQWLKVPPIATSARSEIMRFTSIESGESLIVLRGAYDAKQLGPQDFVEQIRQSLIKGGAANFVPGEATIGSRRALTLNYTEATRDGGTANFRHYFVFDGALWHMLRFGSLRGEAPFELFDRMAKSFAFENS